MERLSASELFSFYGCSLYVVNGMCVLSLIITGTQPAVEVEDRKKTIFLCEGVIDSSRLKAFSRWRSIDVIGVGLASDYIRALSRTHPQ